MKKITFKISQDGKVLFDYDGFQGDTCLEEFQRLLEVLKSEGMEIEARETKRKVVQNGKQEIVH
ncbi:MAG: hypothetical protein QW540_04805 [Archaeoglobaceae archaeon]